MRDVKMANAMVISFTLVQEEIENSLWLTLLAMEIWGTRLLQKFLYGGVPKNP